MGASASTGCTLRFGTFEADLLAGELRKQGIRIRLQAQPFQVLALLLKRPGELVTREELREELWPEGTFVDFEHGLNAAVNRLREALEDSPEVPRFIETVPRHGYRFLAPVEVVVPPTQASAASKLSSLRISIGLLSIACLLLLLVWADFGGFRERLAGSAPREIRAIAVLPLANLSADPDQDYFADGMTEAIITELGKIGALRVISRQSVMQYKGSEKPLPQIARELNVDALVEGSAIHDGDKVRITAQLVAASPERHLWAESYEESYSDVLLLQSRLARAIAGEIRIAVTPEEETRLASARTVNPSAHEAYLKGRYYWNKRTVESLERAAGYFQQAIEEDPAYAPAYTGLADAFILLPEYGDMPPEDYLAKAMAAAARSLDLDPALAEAHASYALAKCYAEHAWNEAEAEFQQAIRLNPNYATARHWYAHLLMLMGRHEESIREIERARTADPLSLIINENAGYFLYLAGFHNRAAVVYRDTLALDPNFAVAHRGLGLVHLAQARYPEAIAELQKATGLEENNTHFVAELGAAYAAAGEVERAREILEELHALAKRVYVKPYSLAVLYTALGRKDEAFAALEKAYEERSSLLLYLKVDPLLGPLRSDPRFEDLLQRMRFPPARD